MNIVMDAPKEVSWKDVEVGDVVMFNTGRPYMLIAQEIISRGETKYEYNLMRLRDTTTCQWDWYESKEQLFEVFSKIEKIIKADDIDMVLGGK